MLSSQYFHFLFLFIIKHKVKHLLTFFLAAFLIFLLSSVLFISSSIQKEFADSLKVQSDFVIKRIVAGKQSDMDIDMMDDICSLHGISSCKGRVHARYYYDNGGKYFNIIGVDIFDESVEKFLDEMKIDSKSFATKNSMIVGRSVATFMKEHYYTKYFNFKSANGQSIKVDIIATMPSSSDFVSANSIIMSMPLAKEILSMGEESISDIALSVANDVERESIIDLLLQKRFDIMVISKEQILQSYEKMFNFKGGVFMILFIVAFLTFLLLLYERYNGIASYERKEVALLRSVGWNIQQIVRLKLFESIFIGVNAYLFGVILAYIFVYFLNAPLLSSIFLGAQNLKMFPSFMPVFDVALLLMILLFFLVPFIGVSIFPAWRASLVEPSEILR